MSEVRAMIHDRGTIEFPGGVDTARCGRRLTQQCESEIARRQVAAGMPAGTRRRPPRRVNADSFGRSSSSSSSSKIRTFAAVARILRRADVLATLLYNRLN